MKVTATTPSGAASLAHQDHLALAQEQDGKSSSASPKQGIPSRFRSQNSKEAREPGADDNSNEFSDNRVDLATDNGLGTFTPACANAQQKNLQFNDDTDGLYSKSLHKRVSFMLPNEKEVHPLQKAALSDLSRISLDLIMENEQREQDQANEERHGVEMNEAEDERIQVSHGEEEAPVEQPQEEKGKEEEEEKEKEKQPTAALPSKSYMDSLDDAFDVTFAQCAPKASQRTDVAIALTEVALEDHASSPMVIPEEATIEKEEIAETASQLMQPEEPDATTGVLKEENNVLPARNDEDQGLQEHLPEEGAGYLCCSFSEFAEMLFPGPSIAANDVPEETRSTEPETETGQVSKDIQVPTEEVLASPEEEIQEPVKDVPFDEEGSHEPLEATASFDRVIAEDSIELAEDDFVATMNEAEEIANITQVEEKAVANRKTTTKARGRRFRSLFCWRKSRKQEPSRTLPGIAETPKETIADEEQSRISPYVSNVEDHNVKVANLDNNYGAGDDSTSASLPDFESSDCTSTDVSALAAMVPSLDSTAKGDSSEHVAATEHISVTSISSEQVLVTIGKEADALLRDDSTEEMSREVDDSIYNITDGSAAFSDTSLDDTNNCDVDEGNGAFLPTDKESDGLQAAEYGPMISNESHDENSQEEVDTDSYEGGCEFDCEEEDDGLVEDDPSQDLSAGVSELVRERSLRVIGEEVKALMAYGDVREYAI